MKAITFAIPCFNSASYMEKCVASILPLGSDIEIILVDDGSTLDDTPAICDRLAAEHPDVIRAIHQENAGHGGAVNTGLKNAKGLYFKVVDSDDWLSISAMEPIMRFIRGEMHKDNPTDLIIANYVYEKVSESKRISMGYRNVFPIDKIFNWDDVGHFRMSQYLLMHSVYYRTTLLRDVNLVLPEHCFYVDNIFVYEPLVAVKTMIYFDVDAYRYFIGREDQSVNEKVMIKRIDQQLQVTKHMIDSVDLRSVKNKKLKQYLMNYLCMMMTICTIFLRLEKSDENETKRKDIWDYLRNRDEVIYKSIHRTFLGLGSNLPTDAGRKVAVSLYLLAQRIFKFN